MARCCGQYGIWYKSETGATDEWRWSNVQNGSATTSYLLCMPSNLTIVGVISTKKTRNTNTHLWLRPRKLGYYNIGHLCRNWVVIEVPVVGTRRDAPQDCQWHMLSGVGLGLLPVESCIFSSNEVSYHASNSKVLYCISLVHVNMTKSCSFFSI